MSRTHRTASMPAPVPPSAPRDMSLTPPSEAVLESTLALAFAPMHKSAFGVAVGAATGLLLFAVTAARLLLDPVGQTDLSLIAQYFAGYSESWPGALVALAWGFGVGFVAGWFAAFVRNLVLATWLFIVRARAELAATRDFLDHI